MSASESGFESPRACPFVALELDRDRRSDRPDYRHRCYAEPAPAPRSIAHQDAYCLSPNFAACPIFQDWATRAAARPVATPKSVILPGAAAAAAGADQQFIEPATGEDVTPEPEPEPAAEPEPEAEADEELDGAAGVPLAGAAAAVAADAAVHEQLGAFDAVAPEAEAEEAHSSWGQPDAGYQEPPAEPALPADYIAPPAERDEASRGDFDAEPPRQSEVAAEAAVPAFLAGRSARPPNASSGPLPPPHEPVDRDDIVPSWEIDGRFGAEAPPDPGGSRMDTILTAVAVIVIIGLGIAGVLFLPGFLAGGSGGSSTTPNPSFVAPSVAASSAPSVALDTAEPTVAPLTAAPTAGEPTASAGPEASPRSYRIKSGDTLARIAKKFKVLVADILAANPQIKDANHIEVGQVIIIPLPPTTPEASSAP
jgi:LysM repeat protein